MAATLTEKSDGKIIEVVATGKLHRDDYQFFVPKLDRAIKRHGKIRLLFHMIDFQGWTACALWEDVKFDVRHYSDVERLALVGDKAWQKGMGVFCKPFTTAEVRFFELKSLDDAHDWISKGIAADRTALAHDLSQSPASSRID